MSQRRLKIALVILFTLFSDRVLADDVLPPHVVVTSGDATLETKEGVKYTVPTGTHILDGTSFQRLDDTLKEQQDLVTRYKAENKSLKESLNSWSPGVGTMLVLIGSVVAVGAAVHYWP